MDFKKRELVKLEIFSIKGWMENMSNIFWSDYVYLGIIFVWMTFYGIYQTHFRQKGDQNYRDIQTLGPTNDREYELWSNYRYVIDLYLTPIFYCVGPQTFIKDLFVILSAYLRGVKIRSSTFKIYFILDLIVFSVPFILEYCRSITLQHT